MQVIKKKFGKVIKEKALSETEILIEYSMLYTLFIFILRIS